MSISRIQRERAIEAVARTRFMSGEKPTLSQITRDVSSFFADNPIGQPLNLPLTFVSSGLVSDVNAFNEIMANLIINLEFLYQSSREQVEEVLTLTSILNAELSRLKARRKRLEGQIDDYLFTLYNADGYYYSFSDNFADLSFSDLALTSAFVDTDAGAVTIPYNASRTKVVSPERMSGVVTNFFRASDAGLRNVRTAPPVKLNVKNIAPTMNAFDGLTNTVWQQEVEVAQPTDIICKMRISVGTIEEPAIISKLDFEPYGVTPVQVLVETAGANDQITGTGIRTMFGNKVQTDTLRMTWSDNAKSVGSVHITLRKSEPDYTVEVNGQTRYRYIFGAKEIIMSEQVYDNSAQWISKPIGIPDELSNDQVIDAISITTVQEEAPNTELNLYVAAHIPEATEVSDFEWRKIEPLSEIVESTGDTIIKFDGAISDLRDIVEEPDASQLQLILPNSVSEDPKERNPTTIDDIPGVDIWRIVRFNEDVIPASTVLEEGVNTTKILYNNLDTSALSLDYWTNYRNGTTPPSNTVYGRIDTGDGYFYGGNVGESGVSVFVETFLESDTTQETILREIRKSDPNSKQWDMKVFLNGSEVADLPVGTDETIVPWTFQQGLNNVILLINIPVATPAYPNVYVGSIDLMNENSLFDFGTVKLGTWKFVDLFKMQYNETGQPMTFTIYNGEVISRRQPTTNFRIRYSKVTQRAPEAIRVRADFGRSQQNPNVAPFLKQYRLRFLYN